tara:strand:- start:1691 stop:1891 length:201 start_codon:yes stop_codon:yes gene_type:complete
VSNRPAIHEELFNIVYFGNGFTYSDVYNMPLPLRRYYVELMIKSKKLEQKEMEKANQSPMFKNPTT